MSEMIEIGGLYKKQSKDGKTFLTGRVSRKLDVEQVVTLLKAEGTGLLMFSNSYKTTDKHPDYKLYISAPRQQAQPQAPVLNEMREEDVPF
jgi:hypothetical protein